jgi:hypothetical protein
MEDLGLDERVILLILTLKKRVWWCELDSYGSGQWQVAASSTVMRLRIP